MLKSRGTYGYHTCRKEGGEDYVLKNAPFKSVNCPGTEHRQWLGEGYYFWTGSDRYAHEWAKRNRFRKGHYIVKAQLDFGAYPVLDLVGEVEDQELFMELIQHAKTHYTKAKKSGCDMPDVNFDKESVGDFIIFLQYLDLLEPGIFNFVAVKAQDQRSEMTVRFSPATSEKLSLVTRQQICIFSDPDRYITGKSLHFES